MSYRLLLGLLLLAARPLEGQASNPAGPVRVTNQPQFRALDGTISQIRKGEPAAPLGALHLLPGSGRFSLTFVTNDATGCVGPHSVEHQIQGDTITVTLFDNAPDLCPMAITPTEYTLTLSNLRPVLYLLRVYREGRGGRGGRASGVPPWLSIEVDAH
jgi:hypothetical protein